jgi:ADP-heptose:LPS heptosyltransferase
MHNDITKVSIPLFSGIGNVIQSLPFIHEMKKRYKSVTAFNNGLDFPQAAELVRMIITIIYKNSKSVPSDTRKFVVPKRRSFPESKSWFIDNNEPLPEKLEIPFIPYDECNYSFDVVLWPECKPNWICKKWPYWKELADLLSKDKSVAIVGTTKEYSFNNNVIDLRGQLSLKETGGVLKNANLFIGNEGGISHYSAALGTKTFVILGCTDPIKNLPPNNAIGISKELPCQPCQFRNLKQQGIIMHGCDHVDCLNKLTPIEVMEKIS